MAQNTKVTDGPEILDDEQRSQSLLKKLAGYAGKIPFARNVVAMVYAIADPEVPATKKLIIAGAVAYFVSPVDLIPDFIPVIGKLDDYAVIMAAYRSVRDIITPTHLEKADAYLKELGR